MGYKILAFITFLTLIFFISFRGSSALQNSEGAIDKTIGQEKALINDLRANSKKSGKSLRRIKINNNEKIYREKLLHLLETREGNFLNEDSLNEKKYLHINELRNEELKYLAAAKSLIQIYFANLKDPDFSGLKEVQSLRMLHVWLDDNKHITFGDLDQLEDLYIRGDGIQNLDSIQSLSNLKNFIIESGSVNDLNGLKNLKNLEELDLWCDNLTSTEELGQLEDLKRLRIISNKLQHIGLPSSVDFLDLSSLEISSLSNITGIESLSNVKNIEFMENKLKDLSGFENLTNIKSLVIKSSEVESIDELRSLSKLESLYLNGNAFEDFSALSYLEKLTYLKLKNISSKVIKNSDNFKHVENLEIDKKDIADLRDFSEMKNLKVLSIYGDKNQIQNFLKNATATLPNVEIKINQ